MSKATMPKEVAGIIQDAALFYNEDDGVVQVTVESEADGMALHDWLCEASHEVMKVSEFQVGDTVTVGENTADSMSGNAEDTGVITNILEDTERLFFVTFKDWGDYFEARYMTKSRQDFPVQQGESEK